mmetsp:Transcript_77551/g.171787  ORF Transcript_77551/g.171787 Transcript_77551/m.171787 type:complete len:312 (-) Transcript_77551:1081-2016(-)
MSEVSPARVSTQLTFACNRSSTPTGSNHFRPAPPSSEEPVAHPCSSTERTAQTHGVSPRRFEGSNSARLSINVTTVSSTSSFGGALTTLCSSVFPSSSLCRSNPTGSSADASNRRTSNGLDISAASSSASARLLLPLAAPAMLPCVSALPPSSAVVAAAAAAAEAATAASAAVAVVAAAEAEPSPVSAEGSTLARVRACKETAAARRSTFSTAPTGTCPPASRMRRLSSFTVRFFRSPSSVGAELPLPASDLNAPGCTDSSAAAPAAVGGRRGRGSPASGEAAGEASGALRFQRCHASSTSSKKYKNSSHV